MQNISNQNFILINIRIFNSNNINCIDFLFNHPDCEILNSYEDYNNNIIYYLKFIDLINVEFIEFSLDNILENINIRYNIMIYESNKKFPRTIRINKNKKKITTKSQTKILSI
jgi:hypothetical protein